MASTIQEYLKQARAAGATPTFTNIGGDNPMLAPGPGRPMGGTQAPGAYLIQEQGGNPTMDPSGMVTPAPTPAIPAQGQSVTQSQVGQSDPWAMSGPATEAMYEEVWKFTFPDKPLGSEISQEEDKKFRANVKSMRNANVDRFKYQQDQINKQKDRDIKVKSAADKSAAGQELSIKQRADYLKEFMNDHATIIGDPMNPMSKQLQGITAQQYAQQRLQQIEAALGGQAIPEQDQSPMGDQGVIPEQGGQAMPGRGPAPGAAAGAPIPAQNAPMDLRKEIGALAAKYGRTPEGRQQAIEELKQRYPQLNIK